jgi:hypothetical protein
MQCCMCTTPNALAAAEAAAVYATVVLLLVQRSWLLISSTQLRIGSGSITSSEAMIVCSCQDVQYAVTAGCRTAYIAAG